MNLQKQKQQGWLALVSVGLIGTLAVTGCDRSEKETVDTKKTEEAAPADTEVVTKSIPVVACDDPMVQDRLKSVLKSTLNQKVQGYATSYANQADINIESGAVNNQVNDVLIDIQKPSVLEATSSNGMTTCQANVSITLPSQDLYQANQAYAAAGRPSLQERMAEQNIRFNNNMLVDEGFSYVAGQQSGEVKTRIVGQPAIIELVSDVMAGSLVQSSIEARRAAINEQKARIRQERLAEQQARRDVQGESRIRQPRVAAPAAPVRPAAPATITPTPKPAPQVKAEPKVTKPAELSANTTEGAKAAAIDADRSKSLTVPTDDSIDMVIIEDESATY